MKKVLNLTQLSQADTVTGEKSTGTTAAATTAIVEEARVEKTAEVPAPKKLTWSEKQMLKKQRTDDVVSEKTELQSGDQSSSVTDVQIGKGKWGKSAAEKQKMDSEC